MKNLFISVVSAAAALATVFSCTRELLVDVVPAQEELSFTAIFADDDTKTAIQSNGTSVWWSGQEKINVFSSSGKSACFTSTGSKDRETAVFTGSFSGSTSGDTFYAVYPYDKANTYEAGVVSLRLPVQQVAKEGSFADELFPSMAVSDNYDFRFYHVCGGFRFTLSQEGIRRITFEAIGGESLAGKATVAFGEGDRPAAEIVYTGQSCIALNAPDGGHFKTGKWYYVVAFPAELSEGYKLSFFKDDSWGNKAYSSSVTIKRGTFGSKQNVDSGVAFTNYETVDLGLPSGTQWASFNIGATVPEEYGDYYAWGETEPKSRYGWNNYRLCNITSDKLTKYCRDTESDSQYWGGEGSPDGKLELEEEDDAACVNWGGSWHIPTSAEMNELRDNCSWSWTKVNGVDGWLFTSKINSATLFLPAAGCRAGTDPVSEAGNFIYYWSSSLYKYDSRGAWNLYNNPSHTVVYSATTVWCYRNYGFSIRPVKSYQPSGGMPVPEAVDLGLSVKWSSFNLGASSQEEYGDAFAWGEIEPINEFSQSNYRWGGTMTKYNNKDGKTILEPADDAASANLGDKWRMPTLTEWRELMDNCIYYYKKVNEVGGYMFESKNNGAKIFLPGPWAGGQGYWSSLLDASSYYYAWLQDSWNGIRSTNNLRFDRSSIRPVYGDIVRVTGVQLDQSSANLVVGEFVKLKPTISPANASERSVLWRSSNDEVAYISDDNPGVVSALSPGSADITVTTSDGGFSTSIHVNVYAKTYNPEEPEPVDLGLSVKWASFNLGADAPDSCGDYFAWGELVPKREWNMYLWEGYKWSSAPEVVTKYMTESDYAYYGCVDKEAVLRPDDDAATFAFGEYWRLPTGEECQELIQNCTWEPDDTHAIFGVKVTGPSGQSIFLPAAGFRTGSDELQWSLATVGMYWSSTLFQGFSSGAVNLFFTSEMEKYSDGCDRWVGGSIRPVYTE